MGRRGRKRGGKAPRQGLALQLEGEHRILELGAGTGYNAALMASMDSRHTIVTCDVVPPVAETAAVRLAVPRVSSPDKS